MNSFVEKFRNEVSDYLERLELGLLILETEPRNKPVIEEIFRLMHSMKGSGGMFGFNLLSEVTHDLESLFELFRTGGYQIDSEVISFTLNSLDELRQLMVLEANTSDLSRAEKLKMEVNAMIARLKKTDTATKLDESFESGGRKIQEKQQVTYFISFVPGEDILINGTNPLYLIDELHALGECNIQVSLEKLPSIFDINPEKCYVSWFLFIATEESRETLNDVFIFVAHQAQLKIEKVSNENVVHDEKIMAGYLNSVESNDGWKITDGQSEHAEDDVIIEHEFSGNQTTGENQDQPKSTDGRSVLSGSVDSIKVDAHKIDRYMNLISELITAQSRLGEISTKLADPELELVAENFEKLGRQLRENAFDMSLVPLQTLAIRFKRLIHDLSKSLDKEVVLLTEGLETELDKNIIEKIFDPLLHIIRNAVDHGIEDKADRLAKNKNEVGSILIKASTVGSSVQIEIEDDGAGLDPVKIRLKALETGRITEADNLSDAEIYSMIFEPGFSTSVLVSDVSGRGVGMDVVKRRIQEMRGTVEVTTEKDQFTRFTLKLPLSVSIIDGLLTVIGQSFYVIPSSAISKIYCSKSEAFKRESQQVINLDDEQIPFLNLHEKFEKESEVPEEQYLVAVFFDNQQFGLVVDEVVREYQAVIKPLGKLLHSQEVFSGASILGTGDLALVIDPVKLIEKYL